MPPTSNAHLLRAADGTDNALLACARELCDAIGQAAGVELTWQEPTQPAASFDASFDSLSCSFRSSQDSFAGWSDASKSPGAARILPVTRPRGSSAAARGSRGSSAAARERVDSGSGARPRFPGVRSRAPSAPSGGQGRCASSAGKSVADDSSAAPAPVNESLSRVLRPSMSESSTTPTARGVQFGIYGCFISYFRDECGSAAGSKRGTGPGAEYGLPL